MRESASDSMSPHFGTTHSETGKDRSSGTDYPEESPTPAGKGTRCREDRTRSEYIGVMIVHHFHGLLMDVNAPMDLQEIALTMVKQEQEHAALCMTAARALGSEEVVLT